jgi:hypothetical protein
MAGYDPNAASTTIAAAGRLAYRVEHLFMSSGPVAVLC